jgi:uncharacterized protein (TIGR02757 family)
VAVSSENRKKIILEYFERFHDPKFLEIDPLLVVRKYLQHPDIEWVALMAAVFAFGGVKQVIASVEKALSILEVLPHDSSTSLVQKFLSASDSQLPALRSLLSTRLQVFRHRIYIGQDVLALLTLYRRSFLEHGSLHAHFLKYHVGSSLSVEQALSGLMADYERWTLEAREQLQKSEEVFSGPHFTHMLNSPADGSACKRWLMFSKWMIRPNDGIDLGLWATDELRAEHLVIPLDTHLWNISKKLGLTRRKTANWLTAIEITNKLRLIDADDPVKYDFALCRWGMLNYRKLIEPSEITKKKKKAKVKSKKHSKPARKK